jgi:hypothetical protein
MAEEAAANERLLRWCGMALVVAGPLIVAASLLHPSRETAATIIASESRLVAAHVLFTLYGVLVMLGLPGLYAAHRGGMGRLGLTGFLVAILGTYLIAVTGYFGFMAPVLARRCLPRSIPRSNIPPSSFPAVWRQPSDAISGWITELFFVRLRASRIRGSTPRITEFGESRASWDIGWPRLHTRSPPW